MFSNCAEETVQKLTFLKFGLCLELKEEEQEEEQLTSFFLTPLSVPQQIHEKLEVKLPNFSN